MAEREIIQNLIFELGQGQPERFAAELDAAFAVIDERTPEELFRFTREFAELVNFHTDGGPVDTWAPFFPASAEEIAAAKASGMVRPDLALLFTFFEQYQQAREQSNQLTLKHLDFYYRRILRFQPRPALPDRAHVLLTLKKDARAVEIRPEHIFSAGKDASGVERIYAPVRRTIANQAQVAALRSIHVDAAGNGTVRFAPIANSADGLGGELPEAEPKWFGFGHPDLPAAEIGFALAAPLLRMKSGVRKVTLTLTLAGVNAQRLNTANLQGAFAVFLTGEKSWIEAEGVEASITGDVATWSFTIPASAPAVVDYNAELHGYTYATEAPIVQLLLRSEGARVGYRDFAGVTVRNAQIAVDVSEVTTLTVENDAGAVDATKAFQPFGPEPVAGSRLMVAYPEALNKRLTRVELEVEWKGAPFSFSSHYANYGRTVNNSTFQATVHMRDASGTEFRVEPVDLFNATNPQNKHTITLTPGVSSQVAAPSAGHVTRALTLAGSQWAQQTAHKTFLAMPILHIFRRTAPPVRAGFITVSLNSDFLHTTYRKKYVQNVLEYARSGEGTPVILNEPYTPTIQSIALSYHAITTSVPVSSNDVSDFASQELQFFQLTPFGPRRDHGYQRAQFDFLASSDVSLLPAMPHAGELLVGVENLQANDSVSLLFQVAPGSGDPDLPAESISWFVLCDNYWRPLGRRELVLDTTNHLRTSGIVQIVVPPVATTINSMLPPGMVWLKAAVNGDVRAVNQLIAVAANAVEVEFVDSGNDPAHYRSALPQKSITKLKDGLAAVKAVQQPFASFGGRAAEQVTSFHTRTSERLRHKDRAIAGWDYERLVLEAFPSIHKVKCVPHASPDSWLAPGHVLLVLVPSLHNRNAVDKLQPRVDTDTLTRVQAYIRARCAGQLKLHVRNPRYQKLRLQFKVRFHDGYEFNFYRNELEQEIIRVLSPWAFSQTEDIEFGGRIAKSVLLDFVEELEYVDYVTDFRMFSYFGDAASTTDLSEVAPVAPDVILVSDASHDITQVA